MRIRHIGMTAHPGGLTKLTVVVEGDRSQIGAMVMDANEDPDEKPFELEIKRVRKKRSLDANAYYWVLVGKLAQALRTSTGAIHRQMLNDYGVIKTLDGRPVTFTLRAGIPPEEVADYTRVVKTGEINGIKAVMYAVEKGSSEMDSKEFSALLDGLISECQEQGIQTATPLELARMEGYVG